MVRFALPCRQHGWLARDQRWRPARTADARNGAASRVGPHSARQGFQTGADANLCCAPLSLQTVHAALYPGHTHLLTGRCTACLRILRRKAAAVVASAIQTLPIAVQGLSAVSAQYRAMQQAAAERLAAGLFARQASAPVEMLQSMIQAGAEDDPDVQAWHLDDVPSQALHAVCSTPSAHHNAHSHAKVSARIRS